MSETLLPTFGEVYEQTRQELHEKPRQRSVGGGRKARLEAYSAKLFFILFYFKCYPTFDLASFIFGMHRSQAHDWVHRLQAVLEAALGKKMVLPERKINSIEAFLERYPTVNRVMIDGTERRIARPKDSEK